MASIIKSIPEIDPVSGKQWQKNGKPLSRYTFSNGKTILQTPDEAKEYLNNLQQIESYSSKSSSQVTAAPTKIDITTGKGVPGGFDASSVKLPDVEAKKQEFAISSIASKAASIDTTILAIKSGKIPSIPGIMDAVKTLTNLASAATAKLKIATKVPDFSKTISIPTPPRAPTVPDFKSLGIPDTPELPSTPSVPEVSDVTQFSPQFIK